MPRDCAHKGMSSHQQHLDWVCQALEILLPPRGKLEPLRVLDLSVMIVVLEIVLSFMFPIYRSCILMRTSKSCYDKYMFILRDRILQIESS